MALTDYERAWTELESYVASRPNHGQRGLALKMMELKAQNALDESLVERMLRMFGVRISKDLRASARDYPSDHGGDSFAGAMAVEPGHRPTDDRGGHDDGSQDRRPAEVGSH